ncbi:MAG: argininosuccinate lyase, partial [Lentisphaerae bacterium]
ARLHTARSRNDQIATDIRLYLRDELEQLHEMLTNLQRALVELADANSDVIMPGFTHLQHAQPILFAHHLLAYVEMLERDKGRLKDALKRMNVCPLGSGALAGSTFPVDRRFCAERLGFADITYNSIDAVSDRDFIIEILSALSLIMVHLSRFSEDIIFWKTQECDFIELGEAFCTGSSIMPQKKNPDVAELTRGKSGRVFGSLMALLTVMKGLPLSYNRDLQEDKESLFDALETVRLVLFAYVPMVRSIMVKRENMFKAASEPSLMATDLAEWLVKQGVPFRTAHKRVGRLVAWCEKHGIPLNELTLEQMQETVPEATAACLELFDPVKSVQARNIPGGTAPAQVEERLSFWKGHLAHS